MIYKIYLGVNITDFTAARLANLTTIMLTTVLSHPQKNAESIGTLGSAF